MSSRRSRSPSLAANATTVAVDLPYGEQRKLEIEIHDGKAHGHSRGWYDNGQMEVDETFVHGGGHGVPGDAVLRLLVEQRPGGGVESGVCGQGAIVEVDGAVARQG